jgi:hypothetical protein
LPESFRVGIQEATNHGLVLRVLFGCLALGRELPAADALADGRLVSLSPLGVAFEPPDAYLLADPPNLRDWPPLALRRQRQYDELELSRRALHPPAKKNQRKADSR